MEPSSAGRERFEVNERGLRAAVGLSRLLMKMMMTMIDLNRLMMVVRTSANDFPKVVVIIYVF